MSGSDPSKKEARAGDADAAVTACLPQDVFTNILVRLPASDLRRFRRVCKEWREIISSPAFIDEHMVHGPRTLTQTIVFLPGQIKSLKHSEYGSGFLFDDQWRVTATFSATRFDEMIGQCNGLLCFLDVCYLRRAIYIVEPHTGESLTLPFPPKTDRWREHTAYCFGFDPSSRRSKIFHQGRQYEQELYVYTVRGGENWRRVEAEGAAAQGYSYGDLVFAHGSVFWSVVRDHLAHLVRFDLSTEEVTSESIGSIKLGEDLAVMPDSNAGVCGMTVDIGWLGESHTEFMGDCGRSTRNNNAITQPHGRRLGRPHARDHLLLNDYQDMGLYAHTIAPQSHELGSGKLLVEACKGLFGCRGSRVDPRIFPGRKKPGSNWPGTAHRAVWLYTGACGASPPATTSEAPLPRAAPARFFPLPPVRSPASVYQDSGWS
ncbi:hypothetical protein ACQ4PT_037851 [Festuca glaucescens]